jgi:hypothetical protein
MMLALVLLMSYRSHQTPKLTLDSCGQAKSKLEDNVPFAFTVHATTKRCFGSELIPRHSKLSSETSSARRSVQTPEEISCALKI